jgi:D-proline reductase (dithiol) PrdB
MGSIAEFTLPVQVFMRGYPWRRIDPVPWAVLRRPLPEARVAIVTSAGFRQPDQPDFDTDLRGGDGSFRLLPDEVDLPALRDSHRSASFDHGPMRADPNLAFPRDRLRELVATGRVGSASPVHLSFMGSVIAPGRLVRDHAPAAAEVLAQHEVDAALLVPV